MAAKLAWPLDDRKGTRRGPVRSEIPGLAGRWCDGFTCGVGVILAGLVVAGTKEPS